MKIFIIGASGFVGRYITKELSQVGHEVIGTYHTSTALFNDGEGIVWKRLDLKDGVGGLLNGIDIVINLSTVHSLMVPQPNISDYLEININAVNNICEAAVASGVKKYIHFSSISAVGKYPGDQLDEIIQTTNPDIYGLTKFAGEQIALKYSENINTIIFRPPGIVGKDYYLCWVGRLLESFIKNENIVAFNEFGLFNNIIGVEEIFRVILDCLNKSIYSGIYNLAANNPMKIGDIMNHLKSLTGSESKIEYESSKKSAFVIDNSRLLSTGFNPGNTLDLITRYVNQNLK